MVQWIIIGALDALSLGLFGWLGGFSSAGDALRRWGESVASA
jgi:hypothetical protein